MPGDRTARVAVNSDAPAAGAQEEVAVAELVPVVAGVEGGAVGPLERAEAGDGFQHQQV
jgi:hypothetical protein